MADYTFDFSSQTTQNPWTVPSPLLQLSVTNFALTNGTGVRSASNGLDAWGVHDVDYIGGSTPIESEVTYNAITFSGDNAGAGVFVRSGVNAGAGYRFRIDEGGGGYLDRCLPSGAATQLTSISGLTLNASDVFMLRYVPSTGVLTGWQNGVQRITFTDATYDSEASLAAGWWISPGNINAQYIKTFAGTGMVPSLPVPVAWLRG